MIILNEVQCSIASQCRENRCCLRQMQVLGLKPGDSRSEWEIEKKYGENFNPRVAVLQGGFGEVAVDCATYKGA